MATFADVEYEWILVRCLAKGKSSCNDTRYEDTLFKHQASGSLSLMLSHEERPYIHLHSTRKVPSCNWNTGPRVETVESGGSDCMSVKPGRETLVWRDKEPRWVESLDGLS